MMACDQSCGTTYTQGGMGCGGGMMGHQGMGGGMGYPGAGWGPGAAGYQQGPAAMGYQQGPAAMGYQQGPAAMGYQQGPEAMGQHQGPAAMGHQQGPMGYQPMGCQPGPFEPGSGCGGLGVACGPQGADIPPQARTRKPRPPSSTIPKRKIGTSYTTLVTPLAEPKELTEENTKNIPPDHERFDTLTLAFGTKPGTDKPPKILLTLKSPKVIDAKLSTGTAGTQVNYRDLGLPDPNPKPDDTRTGSRRSKGSRGSKMSAKTSKKGSRKGSKGRKGKK